MEETLTILRQRQKGNETNAESNGFTITHENRNEIEQKKRNLAKRRRRKGSEQRKLRKRKLIYETISTPDSINIDALRHLALTTDGLVCKPLRRRVWPLLVGVETTETVSKPSLSEIQAHKDYQQVYIDVIRCLRRFPPDVDYDERMALQDQLTNLIIRIIMKHPELYYYQGYHDICVTFLIEVGEELAFAIMDKLSVTVLKKFMEKTMDSTVEILNCICPLIGKYSPELLDQLDSSGIDTIFCLSWIITWFGHVLDKHSEIVRLYDVFLASDPLMPVYLAAALVLHRESEVLKLDRDMATVHHFLSNLPDDLPLEMLIKRAIQLCEEYPPNLLTEDIKPAGRFHKMLLKSRTINKNGSKVSKKLTKNRRWFHVDFVLLSVTIAAGVGAVTFGIMQYVVRQSNTV